ncbi:hypothetical protein GCM10009858_24030 [Terrabacter carboxydivorans]|uniref:PH domain-containing protein n=1 Tax=Terrabacter carboxydivorans TaxID=619730 RepID=A0ABN3LK67_9MICO
MRSVGYAALWSGIWSLFLLIAMMGFTDPAPNVPRDSDWMFWVMVAALLGLLCRAPFVGLVIRSDRVTRRSWLRSTSWPRSDVSLVRTAGYSGMPNWYGESGLFSMVVLTVRGSDVAVPELAGGSRKTDDRLRVVAALLGLPKPSAPGRHRGEPPPP